MQQLVLGVMLRNYFQHMRTSIDYGQVRGLGQAAELRRWEGVAWVGDQAGG